MFFITLAIATAVFGMPATPPDGLKYYTEMYDGSTTTGKAMCAHIYAKWILEESKTRGIEHGLGLLEDDHAVKYAYNIGRFCCRDTTSYNIYGNENFAGQIREDGCWKLKCPEGMKFEVRNMKSDQPNYYKTVATAHCV